MSKMNTDHIRRKFEKYNAVGERGYRHFAVLLPIMEIDGRPCILYEVRGEKLDRQPGEVCFPGGLIEDGETPLQAALRENREEIGIEESLVDVICKLDSIHSTGGSQIHAFLAVIPENALEKIRINEEVSELFTVSVDELMNTAPEIYTSRLLQEPDPEFPYDKVTGGVMYPWRSGKAPVPVYEVTGRSLDGAVAPRIVWGLTGRITRQFIDYLKEEK